MQALMNHFYSKSIFDWVMRLLEAEDSHSFFEKEKLSIIKCCIESIHKEHTQEMLMEKLENYQTFYENMLEKLDDRFDKGKYSSMIKQVLIEKYCLEFLFNKAEEWKDDHEIITKIINIFEIYLKFSLNNRPINPNTSKMSEGGS